MISFTIQNGVSPLYVASQAGQTEVVDTLLNCGADPNLANTVWGLVDMFIHMNFMLGLAKHTDRT